MTMVVEWRGTAESDPISDPAHVAALLNKIKARDMDALQCLYQLFARRVQRYAQQVLRDEHAAEDVVHDVFVRVWRYADSYDPQRSTKPEAWLFQIARNVAVNEVTNRSRARQFEQRNDHDTEDDELEPSGFDPTDRHIDVCSSNSEAFANALRSLPGHCRQAMHLRYHLDMSNPEIARHLGVPLGTAKTWLRRGLMQMRRNLGVPQEPLQEGLI